jgi:hypothetical protein
VKVVLHSLWADEQLADLLIGAPVVCQVGDLPLLGVSGSGVWIARPRARSPVAFSSLRVAMCELHGTHSHKRLLGNSKPFACFNASPLAAEPFAREQTRTRQVDRDPGSAEPFDSLAMRGRRLLRMGGYWACGVWS